MSRQRLLVWPLSILIGWMALLAITLLIERPLLIWSAPVFGARWFATAAAALDCVALAATGWTIGRLNSARPILGVLVFAATLVFWDLSPIVAINVPWLIQLAVGALGDSSYLSPFITTAANQAFLFGSLILGARLSRPPSKFLSISMGR